jgi:hypothetical protein
VVDVAAVDAETSSTETVVRDRASWHRVHVDDTVADVSGYKTCFTGTAVGATEDGGDPGRRRGDRARSRLCERTPVRVGRNQR